MVVTLVLCACRGVTVATDPVLADLLVSDPNEVSVADRNRVAAFYTAILRSTEETFLQYSEGRLDEEYFSNRLRSMLVFLQSRQGQRNWQFRKDANTFDRRFVDRIDEALADAAGE